MPPADRTFAVFASGQGTNFAALASAAALRELGGRIAVLLSDRADAPALARARALGIEAVTIPLGTLAARIDDERRWVEMLRERGVDFVLLAGFLRRLHAPLLEAYAGRMLNIHPSLLPAFPGLDAIRRAWEAGVRVTGCTVHLVSAALDQGPILAQAEVARRPADTLAELEARVHEAEHALYPATVHRFLTEPWRLDGARVRFGEGPGWAGMGAGVAHG